MAVRKHQKSLIHKMLPLDPPKLDRYFPCWLHLTLCAPRGVHVLEHFQGHWSNDQVQTKGVHAKERSPPNPLSLKGRGLPGYYIYYIYIYLYLLYICCIYIILYIYYTYILHVYDMHICTVTLLFVFFFGGKIVDRGPWWTCSKALAPHLRVSSREAGAHCILFKLSVEL